MIQNQLLTDSLTRIERTIGPMLEFPMFFRFQFVSLVVLSTVFIGCTPRVGEQAPISDPLELSSTKCLNQAVSDIKGFFEASTSDAQLDAAWVCVETGIGQFEKYVSGKDQDRYTSQEIVTFLESYFFDSSGKNKITPALQIEAMKLKKIFIGGDTEYVTRQELRKSQEFLTQFARMTVKLNRHMKVIVLKWKPQLDSIKSEDLKIFEAANVGFQEFAVELAGMAAKNVSLYNIVDVVVLLKEFEKFFEADWEWVRDIEKLVPAIKKLKIALAGGEESTINEKEWKPVLVFGARGYFQYLRYKYFIETTPETGGAIRLVYLARTLEDVFSIFQDLVAQKNSGTVTAREVYELVHAFEGFWEQVKVSQKLVDEIMKLKQVLIGGTTSAWTASDFESAKLKVPALRNIIEKFMPYFSVYAFEWDPEIENPDQVHETFEKAKYRLAEVGHDFGEFLIGSYSYDDLVELLTEFENLYPPQSTSIASENISLVGRVKQYRDVFVSAKSMVYQEADTIVRKEQWVQILPWVGRVFSAYQYQYYFLKGKNWKSSASLQDLQRLVKDVINCVEILLSLNKEKYFNQADLIDLTLKLAKTDLVNLDLQPKTVDFAWTALLQHMLFDPEKRQAGEKNTRLTMRQFEILQLEFSIWAKTQISLNEIFNDNPELELGPTELLKQIKDRFLAAHDEDLRKGLEGIYTLLNSTVTATWDRQNHLEISNRVDWNYRLNALFQTNLTRSLTRVLTRGFSGDPHLNRINKCDSTLAFELLSGVFRDLDIIDTDTSFITARFLEANVFMPRGNGDNFLDFVELGELMNVIFSGMIVNNELVESMKKVCPVYTNDQGKEFVTYKCISEHHYFAVRKIMTALPEFKSYVEKMAANDKENSSPGLKAWDKVFRETLKAAGWKANKGYGSIKEESVLLSSAIYYPFIVHYIELIYARIDYTKNAHIQSFEAIKAFPRFKPLLKELASEELRKGLIKEKDLLSLFTYILQYKERPGFSTILRWLGWINSPKKWEKEMWVGRDDIVEILAFIADETSKAGSGGEAPVCKASDYQQRDSDSDENESDDFENQSN
jgi:hypothetical protein